MRGNKMCSNKREIIGHEWVDKLICFAQIICINSWQLKYSERFVD